MRWILVIAMALLLAAPAAADPLDDCRHHIRHGAPGTDGDLLCRLGYLLAHDGDLKVPRWVAYHVTAERTSGPVARSDDFRPDPDLAEGRRAELADYLNSGYDRGHMMPAAKNQWSEQAMSESFLLSNMAPQVGVGFNRHIWARLEAWARDWAAARGELYVVTGPVIVGQPIERIGPGRVAVPTHFYKVIFDPIRVEAIAFLLPNTALPTPTLPAYVTSVRHIERLTGLDFHSELAPEVADLIEERVATLWER